jgi:hypothetical protein
MDHKVKIRVTLGEVDGCHREFESLPEFLQYRAQDAVNILQETYGSGMAPELSIVSYEIVAIEDGATLVIEVEAES